MAIPPAPWSPSPRMRSLSVTTIRRMSRWRKLRSRCAIWPRSLGQRNSPLGRAVNMAELLAGLANGGGADDGCEPLQVLHQQAIEQRFITVEQCDQSDVLFERVALGKDVLEFHRHLLLDGQHRRGQQTFDA